MIKKLIYNYWLIGIAWCMFLNDLTLLAVILGLLGMCVLLSIDRGINYWRMSFMSVISYVIISFILSYTNIYYYFENIYIFLAVICLDLSFTFERLYLLKSKCLKPFLAILAFSLSVLSLIALVLPNSLYTLFTKKSLYVMINIIFLPYLVPLVLCYCYKKIRRKSRAERIFLELVKNEHKVKQTI